MNVIDQAFVKAFARRSQPQTAHPTVQADAALAPSVLQATDVTVHPRATESAVLWYDSAADQQLRRDGGHRLPNPLGDTTGLQTPRSRRPLAMPPTDEVLAPAESTPLAPNEPTSPVDLSALYHSEVAFAVQPVIPVCDQPVASPLPAAPEVVTSPPAIATVAAAPAPVAERFIPVWEVDRFEFSNTITALFSDPALVQSIGHPLDRAVNEGLQTLLITGDRAGVGQTSVATGIAISAAAAGLRVALVDATATMGSRGSTLADTLNLDVQQGWPEVLRAGRSLAEAAVHSIEDQLTVLPQASPYRTSAPTEDEFRQLILPLRAAFDLVVIDGPCCREPAFKSFTGTAQPISNLPPATSAHRAPVPRLVDAVILVQDIRNADQLLAQQLMQSLRFHGITGLGLVENFT